MASVSAKGLVGAAGGIWVKMMSEEQGRAHPEQCWRSECTGASPAWPCLPWEGVGDAWGWILYFPSLFFTLTPSPGCECPAGQE